MPTQRSQVRTEFLSDIFTAAIENGGYAPFHTLKYKWQNLPSPIAEIVFEDETTRWQIDIETIARGLGVIRAKAPELLSLNFESYKMILQADRENDASNLDVVLALAILECALFGKVVYA